MDTAGERWIDLDLIDLWDQNPNEGDIGAIIPSIAQFGFNASIGLWRRGSRSRFVVKTGNHRVIVLRLLRTEGYNGKAWTPRGDGIRVGEGGKWFVRYLDLSYLSEAESDGLALADNRTARLGHDNPAQLLYHLLKLEKSDPVMREAAGYSLEAMDDLHRLLNLPTTTELEAKYGLPEDEQFYPTINVRVPPDVYSLYRAATDGQAGDTEAARFAAWVRGLFPVPVEERS